MAVWKYRVEDIQEKSTSGKYHPVIETLLETRGYDDEESRQRFLFPSFDRDIYDPFLFSQMERVVSRIGETKKNKETIGVFGDFDADGVTSSVIIREALTALHIPVEVYIPEKMNEGHGFNILAVDFFESKGIKLILTLDCGMTNHEAISEAKKRGIETIVVDHHHVPEILPEAYAIINPKI
ncbi:MAG TPA: single-stranded-DNA-specific exonuclease RecJ, partial [Candidatus Moranbacteria bacterium]|nr:single-stranded-DNA-specific exonuclease RecJ [Candidatus Moranbacteria bacterium]